MIPQGQLTGAVLAGGESRRMGRDKATLEVDGRPLWQRQVNLLRSVGANPVGIVRRPGQPALGLPAEVPLWHDTVAGIGPLAGLHAALTACSTGWLAVVAADMPRIDASWFQWLGAFCSSGCGAIGQRTNGTYEPLAAIYPQAALAEIERRITGSDHSLQALAQALVAGQHLVSLSVPESEIQVLANWHTPPDAGLVQ